LHLRDSILPAVNAAAIVTALTAAWARTDAASYPLSAHNPERVVSELTALYVRVADDHRNGASSKRLC
jgi:hypothetical protein